METFLNGYAVVSVIYPKKNPEIHSTIMNKKSRHFFLTVRN